MPRAGHQLEAAAALRQAQKLMAAHNITEEDVGVSQYVNDQVITDYEYGRKKPVVLSSLISLVCAAIGVEACWELGMKNGKALHAVRYFGRKDRVAIAKYAHEVCWRVAAKAWKEFSEMNPSVKKRQGARAGFFVGWCYAVRSKVEDLRPQGDEANAIKKAKHKHYEIPEGEEMGKAKENDNELNMHTAAAGVRAGQSFSIHKPVR